MLFDTSAALPLQRRLRYSLWMARSALGLIPWTSVLPSPLVGIGAAFLIAANSFNTVLLATLGMACLISAFLLSPRTEYRPGVAWIAAYSALLWMGIIYTGLLGWNQWLLTLILAEWSLVLLMVYCTRIGPQVWAWFSIGTIPHIAACIYQGFSNWRVNEWPGFRATGLCENPNIAAGLIDVVFVYLILQRKWYLTPPLMVALYFTGTRLAFWGLYLVLIAFVFLRIVSWKYLLTLMAGVALFAWASDGQGYRLWIQDRIFVRELLQEEVENQIVERLSLPVRESPPPPEMAFPTEQARQDYHLLALPPIVGLYPHGDPGSHNAHNGALRLLYHAGIVGVAAWGVLCISVWRRPVSPYHLWLLALLLLLSTLDYYTVMPPFSIIWFMVFAANDSPSRRRRAESFTSEWM